jgi:hypothetical protein
MTRLLILNVRIDVGDAEEIQESAESAPRRHLTRDLAGAASPLSLAYYALIN